MDLFQEGHMAVFPQSDASASLIIELVFSSKVEDFVSLYDIQSDVDRFCSRCSLCSRGERNVIALCCSSNEGIHLEISIEGRHKFVYFYDILFLKLGIRLPLSSFEFEILSVANVVPSPFHLNSWAFVRWLSILYSQMGNPPSKLLFFSFFTFNYGKK